MSRRPPNGAPPSDVGARLKRVFNIDIETCQACGGPVRIIACIEDPVVTKKILDPVTDRAAAGERRPLPESRAQPCLFD